MAHILLSPCTAMTLAQVAPNVNSKSMKKQLAQVHATLVHGVLCWPDECAFLCHKAEYVGQMLCHEF